MAQPDANESGRGKTKTKSRKSVAAGGTVLFRNSFRKRKLVKLVSKKSAGRIRLKVPVREPLVTWVQLKENVSAVERIPVNGV